MSEDSVVVEIASGLLKGLKAKTVYGFDYFSFQGIPYAKPPLGDLRFKPPERVTPWEGVRHAYKEGNVAPQYDFVTKKYVESSSEDCLYLNVYTNNIPNEKSKTVKQPVMFFIHGGGFKFGSGNTNYYGPDFLVPKDVVLVTCNYRLGPLGFLSLGTKEYPGNYGLKDIVFALKWVQENIEKFGGDPENVTIFGESAGAAAVEFIALSKNTKNLFHKAICQSGSCLNPWALTKNAREYAFFLGELLGCKTKDDETLIEHLKKVTPYEMVTKEKQIIRSLVPGEQFDLDAFIACVEPDSEDSIISKEPFEYFVSGEFPDIPFMSGQNDAEGMLYLENGVPKLEKEEDFERFVPYDIPKEIVKEIAKKVKNFYFPDGFSKIESVYTCIRILGTIYFLNGINHVVEALQKNPIRQSPTYYYLFSYDGQNGFYKRLMNLKNYPGVCHCDELGYLFHVNAMAQKAAEGSKEFNMIQTMTSLWTNFAKCGDPNIRDSMPLWKPISEKEKYYMEIGNNLILKKDYGQEDVNFWKEIFNEIRNY